MAKLTRDTQAVAARRPAFLAMLEAPAVRRIPLDDRTLYALPDVLALLVQTTDPEGFWRQLVHDDPILADYVLDVPFGRSPGQDHKLHNQEADTLPATDAFGMMRIVQSIPSSRAEAARRWLAAAGTARMEEASNPELAIQRARDEFHRRGYPQQWIDHRMRSMAARAQIVGEWHRRGATEGMHYRDLTNALFVSAFDLDVEAYKKTKGLAGSENLRDHMSEVELALVTLGETVGAELHRLHGRSHVQQLVRDMHDAGAIVAEARRRIESASGKPVVEASRKPWIERKARAV
jgi:hypothetical protein